MSIALERVFEVSPDTFRAAGGVFTDFWFRPGPVRLRKRTNDAVGVRIRRDLSRHPDWFRQPYARPLPLGIWRETSRTSPQSRTADPAPDGEDGCIMA